MSESYFRWTMKNPVYTSKGLENSCLVIPAPLPAYQTSIDFHNAQPTLGSWYMVFESPLVNEVIRILKPSGSFYIVERACLGTEARSWAAYSLAYEIQVLEARNGN